MVQDLTLKDYRVLLAIQENPLGTYDDIATKTGSAKSVVFKIVQKLVRNQSFRVNATLNSWNLGLEIVEVLVQADSERKLSYVERLCDEHPYTMYRARCFGDTNGLLVQFRSPRGTSDLISALFHQAQKKQWLDSFDILPFEPIRPIFTTARLNHWDATKQSWIFDWNQWFNFEVNMIPIKAPSGKPGIAKKWLKISDLAILNELFINARQLNSQIIESLANSNHPLYKGKFKLTPQTFSRRLKRINKECIEGHRVILNPDIFEFNSLFVWGVGNTEELNKLQSKMITKPIPFMSTFKVKQDQLFWYLHIPTTHLSDLLHHLRPILADLRYNFIDMPRSETYGPYYKTFDEKKSNWRTDKEFMIKKVLRNISN